MADKPPFAGEARRVRLGDVCSKGKSTLRQKDVVNDGPYPVYGASGIIGTRTIYQNEFPCVAVVKDGAGVGRAMLCEPKSSVLGTMQTLLPKEGVSCRYLLHLVRSLRLGEGFTGSTIPHIYFKDYSKRLVLCPSLVKQERLVGRLEAIELLESQGARCLSLLDDLVKSRFVEMFGDGSSFCQLPLSACVSAIDSGKSPKCAPGPRRGTKPGVLKLSGISSGVYLEHENKALPSEDSFVAAKEVIDGDILLARKNTPELVGRSVLVHKTAGRIMFPDIVFRMHPNDDVEGAYLSHLLGGPYFDKVRSLAHGSAKSMSNIPKSELARLCVPVPPLALQREFAAFAAEVGKSRVVVQQQIKKLQTLYDSLAQDYFG